MFIVFTNKGAAVKAEWLGKVRVIKEGNFWECLEFVRQNKIVALASKGLKLKKGARIL